MLFRHVITACYFVPRALMHAHEYQACVVRVALVGVDACLAAAALFSFERNSKT